MSSRPRLSRTVWLVGFASLLNDTASEMIYPLLPKFLIETLGGNKQFLGLVEGIADATASLLKLWSGSWSDRLGSRRGLVALGYVLATVTRPLIGLATVPWHVLLARFGDRIGKGIRTAPRDALITDVTASEQQGRAFGLHRAMDHAGAVLGPALATTFLLYWPGEIRTLFLLSVLPGIAAVVVIWFGVKETRRETPVANVDESQPAHFSRTYRHYLVAAGLFALGNASDAFLLVRAGELGIVIAFIPLLWGGYHILKSAANIVFGWIADRIGARISLAMGWVWYAIVMLGFGLASEVWHAIALFAAHAIFMGLTEPSERKMVAELTGSQLAGRAFGQFHFITGVTTLPASLIFGALYDRGGALAAFGYAAALAVVALVVFVPLLRKGVGKNRDRDDGMRR